MTQQTRYRVVGGVFFLSLAVIFVPMLFDESRGPEIQIEPLETFEIEPSAELSEPDVSEVVARHEQLREIVDEDGYLISTGSRLGDPSFLPSNANVDSWVVQLGSFQDRVRADALRTQLKNDGHATWISHAKIQGEIMIRVAIGPYDDFEETIELRDVYREKYNVDAVVKGFQP